MPNPMTAEWCHNGSTVTVSVDKGSLTTQEWINLFIARVEAKADTHPPTNDCA